MIGTMKNDDVEEVYGGVDEPYTISEYISYATAGLGDIEITSYGTPRFSHDGNYMVRRLTDKNGNSYLQSFQVGDEGLIYHQSSSSTEIVIKKYLYTFEELGLDNNCSVSDIAFGAAGYAGKSTQCILAILFSKDDKKYVRLLTYHLEENGVIGKMSDYSTDNIEQTIELPNTYFSYICGCKTNPYDFFIAYLKTGMLEYPKFGLTRFNIASVKGNDDNYNITYYNGDIVEDRGLNWYISRIQNTDDGKYVIGIMRSVSASSTSVSISTGQTILYYTGNNTPSKLQKIGSNSQCSELIIPSKNMMIEFLVTNKRVECSIMHMSFETDHLFTSGIGSAIIEPTIDCDYVVGEPYITKDESKIMITLGKKHGATSTILDDPRIYVIDLEELLLSMNTSTAIKPEQIYYYPNSFNFGVSSYICAGTTDGTRVIICQDTTKMTILSKPKDNENLIGIYYKNKFFSSVEANKLSAQTSDVRKDKTFIGYNGVPETGTMEV